jgi:serine/threonine protein kinase
MFNLSVAIKSLNIFDMQIMEIASRELKFLFDASSPFIVKYHGSFVEDNLYFIIMEHCEVIFFKISILTY